MAGADEEAEEVDEELFVGLTLHALLFVAVALQLLVGLEVVSEPMDSPR